MARFKRLLITGAAGRLGSVLRSHAHYLADTLRLTDIADMGKAAANEEIIQCDQGDFEKMLEITRDVDAVVHLGGIPLENTFENILHANIRGTYNVYEACRRNGVKRIVYGSSNHAIGFYEREAMIGSDVPHRPDSIYGVSKAFAEDLARYYYDKFRIETVSIRIGSSFEEPTDRRMLATWLSFRDFVELVDRSLSVPRVGFTVVYGTSANREHFWSDKEAKFLGYQPKDSAEVWREQIEANTPTPDPFDPAIIYCGGSFPAAGHYEDNH
ncbi:NAD-dependent epimerase/dehydratase family protein [Klebsiella variicola]|uniref:NAD-dependent epimerase/dehydratase family protein n=1 Tax=Klebsiella variicola TaxID=244366 RepID=UPI0023A9631C|nr:NAD(P)-dependent oxidoreductase [Klebsiella variicola]MDD9601313.1 NAD(P)-dependent oxidoreductase [Klebsiella variicola]